MPDASQLPVVADIPLDLLLAKLNARLCRLVDRDHQIGHSYLLDVTTLEELYFAWYHRIIPLLQEYFYQDYERLRAVLGKEFVPEQGEVDDATFLFADLGDRRNGHASIQTLKGHELRAALQNLAGAVSG